MNNNQNISPFFAKPGFIIAAAVLAVILIFGAGAGVMALVNKTTTNTTKGVNSGNSGNTTNSGKNTDSVCGLPGVVLKGTVNKSPRVELAHEGVVAYPKSKVYGPGKTNAEGVRYCFQHSPQGAVMAAANLSGVPNAGPQKMVAWLKYFLAKGPNRDYLLGQAPKSDPNSQDAAGSSDQGVRVEPVGFRVLAYDGKTARIDLVMRGTAKGRSFFISMMYNFIWEDGDWKLQITDTKNPINTAVIPDASGYVNWDFNG